MPKQYPTSSILFNLSFAGPASIEEYNAVAGANILEDAVRGLIAWDTLPEWMEKFAVKFADLTGTTRLVNGKATAAAQSRAKEGVTVKPVLETVSTYVKREFAKLDEAAQAEVRKLAQTVADTIVIDPSPSQRAGKIPADLYAKADSWLTLSTDELEAKIAKGLDLGVTYPLERGDDGKPDRDSLARYIGACLEAMKQGL